MPTKRGQLLSRESSTVIMTSQVLHLLRVMTFGGRRSGGYVRVEKANARAKVGALRQSPTLTVNKIVFALYLSRCFGIV